MWSHIFLRLYAFQIPSNIGDYSPLSWSIRIGNILVKDGTQIGYPQWDHVWRIWHGCLAYDFSMFGLIEFVRPHIKLTISFMTNHTPFIHIHVQSVTYCSINHTFFDIIPLDRIAIWFTIYAPILLDKSWLGVQEVLTCMLLPLLGCFLSRPHHACVTWFNCFYVGWFIWLDVNGKSPSLSKICLMCLKLLFV